MCNYFSKRNKQQLCKTIKYGAFVNATKTNMSSTNSVHQCLFCTQTFKNAAAKDDHILQHFAQETCNECQQNLIRIGGNLYVLHNAATCIREYDYDNENYYDDVSSKLATVLVEGTYCKEEPNEQQTDEENHLEADALEMEVGEWFKSEPNYDEYENSDDNPLQEAEGEDEDEDEGEEEEEEETKNMSTAETTMDEDSQQQQQQQQEAATSAAESIDDENVSQEAMDLSISTEVNIKLETNADTVDKEKKVAVTEINDKEKSAKKEENKRECEFCGEFFHRYALYRHKRDVHNPTVCFCHVCDTHFKSKEYLARHLRYKHGATANVFKCDKCNATFRKKDLFRIHQCNGAKPNENSKTACETCGKEFSRKQSLLKHQVLVHNKSKTIHCKACARVFSDVDERDVHELECAAKKYQQLSRNSTACEICGKVLSRPGALLRHKASQH